MDSTRYVVVNSDNEDPRIEGATYDLRHVQLHSSCGTATRESLLCHVAVL